MAETILLFDSIIIIIIRITALELIQIIINAQVLCIWPSNLIQKSSSVGESLTDH